MKNIEEMSVQDKIIILEYIKKNYSRLRTYWTKEKVEWLENLINTQLQNMIVNNS